MESLYQLWGKRSPQWEKQYQESIMNVFCDYSKGVNQFQDNRAKIFGAGYEIFIIAFFIGLYSDKFKPLNEDKSKLKDFGWAIMNWGNIESRLGRSPYPKIREYMFAALISKTKKEDIIALEKGKITAKTVVNNLIQMMEEYANYGFTYIKEKMEDDPNYFFKDTAFLNIFLSFTIKREDESIDIDDVPESLD